MIWKRPFTTGLVIVVCTVAGISTISTNHPVSGAQPALPLPPTGSQAEVIVTDAQGMATWRYPQPFPTGISPVVIGIVEARPGSGDVLNLELSGTPTNKSAQFRVRRLASSAHAKAAVGSTTLHVAAQPST